MEKISLTTKDNIQIAGTLWTVAEPRALVLLLHMMPATKESWTPLATKLVDARCNVMAIDFRGHGESGGGDYTTFTPQQHYRYEDDARAALDFLAAKFPGRKIFIGGASIGANFSLKFMSEDHSIEKGFALSAGLDYYGVRAIDFVKELSADQSIFLVGARDDVRASGLDCGTQAEQLYEAATSRKDKIIYEAGGHGTDMLGNHPELSESIIRFLTSH